MTTDSSRFWNWVLTTFSPFRSVRARISAAIGISGLLFGLILGVYMEWRQESQQRQNIHNTLASVADDIAHVLGEDLSNRQREVLLMADLIGSNALHPIQPVRNLIDSLQQRHPLYAWIGLAAPDGTVKAASAGLLEGANVAARPWFGGGLKGNYFGDPHEALLLAKLLPQAAQGEPLRFVDIAVPVRNAQGQTQGVLGAHLYWHWIGKAVLRSLAKTQHGLPIEVLITDRSGTQLLSLSAKEMSALTLAPASARPVASSTLYFTAQQAISLQDKADPLRWTVQVRVERDKALEPLYENRRWMVALTLALAFLYALGTWWLAQRVVRSIVALADQAMTHVSSLSPQAEAMHHDETVMVQRAIDRLAHYDGLTGLINRRQLVELLHNTLLTVQQGRQLGAVLHINLDNFSRINNTQGHEVGDQLLQAVAQRLKGQNRMGETVARVGGDEFVILLESLLPQPAQALAQAESLAALVLADLQPPYTLQGGTFSCQASLGLLLLEPQATDAEDVLLHAELAMLAAKRKGKNQWARYDSSLLDTLHSQVRFEEALRAAIPSELLIHLQPQFDHRGELLGAEALVRWQPQGQEMVAPYRFIPVAEETGLILPMGEWVLQTACEKIRQWQNDPVLGALVLSVNVSAKEFNEVDYVRRVQHCLGRTGANPQRLKIELTESALATNVEEVVQKMHAIKALGVSFSLDDFGTGFSSLSYLKRMPLDQLKIDQSFVRDVTHNDNDAAIVKAIIALGQGLSLSVIAEGVETQAQQDFLAQQGCFNYQGYFYGRPMTLEAFEQQFRAPDALAATPAPAG